MHSVSVKDTPWHFIVKQGSDHYSPFPPQERFGLDLFMPVGGIPFTERTTIEIYLKRIHGRARTHTFSYDEIARHMKTCLKQVELNLRRLWTLDLVEGHIIMLSPGPRTVRRFSGICSHIHFAWKEGEWRLMNAGLSNRDHMAPTEIMIYGRTGRVFEDEKEATGD